MTPRLHRTLIWLLAAGALLSLAIDTHVEHDDGCACVRIAVAYGVAVGLLTLVARWRR